MKETISITINKQAKEKLKEHAENKGMSLSLYLELSALKCAGISIL